jgi:Leucine-rich repeat (LRR) protein
VKKLIGNRLQSLPAELGLLTNLRTLAVRSRSKSTSISQDLTAGLQISSNQLTCLPAWLGQLTQLQHLFVRVVLMA